MKFFHLCQALCTSMVAVLLMSNAYATPMAGQAGSLYLPEVDGNTVAVIDTATATVTKRIPVGPIGAHPAVMAATLDGSKLYVDNFGALPATVTVIDRKADKVKTLIVASVPLGIFTSQDGSEIYLPEVNSTVEVISTATDKVVRTLHFFPEIPVASMSGPDGNLYVGFASGLLGVYNPKTGAVIRPPIWSGGVATFWYTFSKDGTKLYTDTINTIGVIDVASWKLVKTINTSLDSNYYPTNPGAFTSTLSPDGSKLYVTLFGATANRVIILDTARDRVIGSIPTKGSVIGLTFSEDGSRGYISDSGVTTKPYVTPAGEVFLFLNLITLGILGPGELIVFDPKTDNVLGTIPTLAGPGVSAWVPPLKP
ncbi:YncE family protein [Aquirhabdus sp.]|uniref:YncE family protein n=1 Tax=Aquirhabdus sp. TaxID=2824160 RepID=UPI00396CE26D